MGELGGQVFDEMISNGKGMASGALLHFSHTEEHSELKDGWPWQILLKNKVLPVEMCN